MNNRQLDLVVAKLLGLQVLGEAPCWRSPEDGAWNVCCFGNSKERQSVYLAHCVCDALEPDDENLAKYFGHDSACLEVVPFYHKDAVLTVAALEQVCETYWLTATTAYSAQGWNVVLLDGQKLHVANGEDVSFPLAIVKALAELEMRDEQ